MVRTNFNNCKVRITNEEEFNKVRKRLEDLGCEVKVVYNPKYNSIFIFNNLFWMGFFECVDEVEEVTVADILGEEKIETQCEHNKIYSNILLCTYPAKHPWICSECGYEGVDTEELYSGPTYEEIKKKFEKKTLWDKMVVDECDGEEILRAKDVKETLMLIADDLEQLYFQQRLKREDIRKIIKARAGKELIE